MILDRLEGLRLMSNLEWNDNAQRSEEVNGDIQPQLTRGEALSNVADLAYTESPFFSGLKWLELKRAESYDERPEIDTQQLNEMYPDLSEPFQEPKKPSVAAIIAGRQRLRQEVQRNISLGPNDYLQSGLSFGTGLLYGLMDPLTVATGFAAEAALLKAAGSAAVGTAAGGAGAAGMAAKGLQYLGRSGFASTAARDVTAGLAEGAVTESIVAASNAEDMTPYTTEDFFMNTVGGAILFPALAGSVRLGARTVGKGLELYAPRSLNDFIAKFESKASTLQVGANSAVKNGADINVDVAMKVHQAEMNGIMPRFAAGEHKFNIIDLDNTKGAKLYGVFDASGAAGPMSYNFEIDGALVITDSPMVANGVAGSRFESAYNKIQEFELNDNLNLARFSDELEDGRTIGQTINDIREDIRTGEAEPQKLKDFYDDLADKGYDGVGGSIRDISPDDIHDHNVMALFNGDKVEVGRSLKADKGAVGKAPEQLDQAKQKHLDGGELIDEADVREITNFIAETQKAVDNLNDPRDFEPVIQEKIEALEQLEAVARLSEEDKIALEALKKNIAETDRMNEVLKAAESCILK